MKTTLNAIREHGPCEHGWVKLLGALGKTKADDEPISILEILESNGLDDALWCLRAVEGYEKEIRLYAVWCARQVQHLMTDKRSLDALDVADAFANGKVTKKELAAARDAARDAAWDAAGYAAGAAWDAAGGAAGGAAWSAARAAAGAAWAAAGGAAWSAAGDAAEAAAWSAAWSAAGAAWAAAGGAAWSAAGDAAEAAAWSAAWSAARAAQEKELIRICKLSEKEKSHV